MNFWGKYWFLIVNILAFIVALFDGFIWRDSNTGFPICTLLGCVLASIVGGIYQLIYTFKNNRGINLLLSLVILYFTVPFYGLIGGVLGLIVGFMIPI